MPALTDVFQVQADIAGSVAGALNVALGSGERQALAERPTRNVAAYDAFLRGEEISDRLATRLPEGAAFYEQAVALDSTFVRAWAQLSRAHSLLAFNGSSNPTDGPSASGPPSVPWPWRPKAPMPCWQWGLLELCAERFRQGGWVLLHRPADRTRQCGLITGVANAETEPGAGRLGAGLVPPIAGARSPVCHYEPPAGTPAALDASVLGGPGNNRAGLALSPGKTRPCLQKSGDDPAGPGRPSGRARHPRQPDRR